MLSKGTDHGVYNNTAPTLSTGDICTLQVDQKGNLKVAIAGGSVGVTSINGLAGSIVLVSSDNSISINVSGQDINFEVGSNLTVSNFASPNVSQWTNDAGYITSSALTGYVPYTGATNNVNLGSHSILASNFTGSSSGANTGDQTITLTGDVTGSGTSSFATTLATVNSNTGSFGSSTAIPNFTVNGKGLITAAGTNVVIAPAGTLTGTTLASNVINSSLILLGTSASLPGSPTTTTQTSTDNSTKIATTAYVTTGINNAIAGINPAISVNAATTAAANTSTWTYNNGVSGIGATFTGPINTAITIDGVLFNAITAQSLLIKNDTQSPSGAFNGVYTFTAAQTGITGAIFTRRLDYDTPSDINNTGAIPVVNGTVNGNSSWLLNSTITTVGTDPITYQLFTPSNIVTAVSVATANGFAGTSSGGTTPALTLTTSITGFLYGNSTAMSAATISTGLTASTSTLKAISAFISDTFAYSYAGGV